MLKGWKTLIVNALAALVGVALIFDWSSIISNPSVTGYIVTGLGILNMVLRTMTNTPVGSSDKNIPTQNPSST
jgi:hypothetical protein